MDDATAMRRRAVLDAYESGCSEHRVRADKWMRGALWEWSVYGRNTEPPLHRLRAAATWEEHDARRRVVEVTRGTADAVGETLPEEVTVQLIAWIHDVEGWNA